MGRQLEYSESNVINCIAKIDIQQAMQCTKYAEVHSVIAIQQARGGAMSGAILPHWFARAHMATAYPAAIGE
jgi:hypothetical protein